MLFDNLTNVGKSSHDAIMSIREQCLVQWNWSTLLPSSAKDAREMYESYTALLVIESSAKQ